MDFQHSEELGGVMADGYFSCTWVKIISTPQYPRLLWTCENLWRKSCSVMLKAQSCRSWGLRVGSSPPRTYLLLLEQECPGHLGKASSQQMLTGLSLNFSPGLGKLSGISSPRWRGREREMSPFDDYVWGLWVEDIGRAENIQKEIVVCMCSREEKWPKWGRVMTMKFDTSGVWWLQMLPDWLYCVRLGFPTFTVIYTTPQSWKLTFPSDRHLVEHGYFVTLHLGVYQHEVTTGVRELARPMAAWWIRHSKGLVPESRSR